ncbi:LarC family nickel insertion protein [Gorillibacterium sp. sgz5001074]|uniref:LarC family nickel insertion protein n=1 Tax=Gorillibacterium sp. sgz5001074 TaxID=3446695 RepID=UPI003F6704A6
MKIIYFDCFSGISGDMALAALADAGADREYIEEELAKIQVEPFRLSWNRVNKKGISALKMDVHLDDAHPPKQHRYHSEIVELILKAGLSERATSFALAIFEKIAIAEAKIHDVPVEHVHFHEVGAMDSIVDVVGVALALDSLEAESIICSPVPLGSGTIHIDHGHYPVPAPATLEMMRGIPIAESRIRKELTTPTGAGIVAGTATGFKASLPTMIVDSIGYGAGTRDLPDQPNVLRVVVGHTEAYLEKWHTHHELHKLEHTHDHAHHHHHHGDGHGHHHHDPAHAGSGQEPAHDHDHGHGHGHDHHHHHSHEHGNDHAHEHPGSGRFRVLSHGHPAPSEEEVHLCEEKDAEGCTHQHKH